MPALNLNCMLLVLLAPAVHGFLLPNFLEFGSCFDYPQEPDFDMGKFAGTWYTIHWVPNEYIPIVACSNSNYSVVDDHIECRERGLTSEGEKKSRVTKLDLLPQGSDSTFMARGEGLRPTAPINVIATDYVSYACTYSCVKSFAMKAEFAWVLSRHPALDRRSLEICDRAFTNKADFDLGKLEAVMQGKDCPYWPHMSPEEKSIYLLNTVNSISPKEHQPKRSEETAEQLTMSSATSHQRPSYLAVAALVIAHLSHKLV